jgi:hypothetical protein
MALTVRHVRVLAIANDLAHPEQVQPTDWGSTASAAPTHVVEGTVDAGDLDLTGVVPITRTINGQPLSADVVLTIPDPDLSGLVLTSDARLSDARVPVAHTQAFSTITGLPSSLAGYGILDPIVLGTRTVNGHALSGDVVVTKGDLGLGSVENTALSTWAGSAALGLGYNVLRSGAVGDGVTDDTLALRAAITTAGVNGTLRFPAGKTFRLSGRLVPLTGQTWLGYGATIKRCNQITGTTSTAIAIGSGTLALTMTTDPVAAGFRVGMDVAVFNGATYDAKNHPIVSIVGNVVTVSTAFGTAFPAGGTVVTSFNQIESPVHYTDPQVANCTRVTIAGLTVDGNKANNTLINKWELHSELDLYPYCDDCVVRDCYVHDCQSEGITGGGAKFVMENNYVLECNGNGIHFSGSIGAAARGNYVKNVNLLGLAPGHADGCIIFSNLIGDTFLLNNYCENGLSGLGSIDSEANSSVVITGNIVKNCTLAIDGVMAGGIDAGRVVIANNLFYNSGPVTWTGGADGTGPYGILIASNYFEATTINLSRVTDVVISGNVLRSPQAATPLTLMIEIGNPKQLIIEGNTIRGGWAGVYIQSAIAGGVLSIRHNHFCNQYAWGFGGSTASQVGTGCTVAGNTFWTDAGVAAATYVAIQPTNGTVVLGNTLQLASGQYGISCPAGGVGVPGAIVAGNIIRSTGLTASIRTTGGSQNNIIKDNYVQQAIVEGVGTTNTVFNNLVIF